MNEEQHNYNCAFKHVIVIGIVIIIIAKYLQESDMGMENPRVISHEYMSFEFECSSIIIVLAPYYTITISGSQT